MVVVLLLILVCPCYIRTFIKSTPLLPKWLHNKWLLRREWNYKPFLPTIRETIDEWIEEQLAKNKLERDDDFSEEMKSDLKDLIQKEIVRQGIDCLLEGYDKDRTIYLNKIIVEGLKSILNSQKESSKSDSSDMQSKSQSKNNAK